MNDFIGITISLIVVIFFFYKSWELEHTPRGRVSLLRDFGKNKFLDIKIIDLTNKTQLKKVINENLDGEKTRILH